MSDTLINPSWTRQVIEFFKSDPRRKVVIALIVGSLILIGIWWTIGMFGTWRANRDVNKLKANVNAASAEIKAAQANLDAAKTDVAVKVEQMKIAVNAAVIAVNATDAGKVEIDRSVQNLANAVNANRPVDTTAADLEKRLDSLGVQ